MADQDQLFYKLNSGEISQLVLARTDLEHLRMAAQSQVNWLPRVLGPMMLRPGTGFIGEIYNDQPTKIIPFIAAFADTALLELTSGLMRVWVNDALVTRAAVTATIPPFSVTWTPTTTGTATATLTSTLTFANVNAAASAIAVCPISIPSNELNVEHAVRIVVANGPVTFQIGSSSGAQDIFGMETLDTGTYSLAFTPLFATNYLQFSTIISAENANTLATTIPQGLQQVQVTSCVMESAGVMTLPTPWNINNIQGPSKIRHSPSADVIYLAAPGVPQYQINRYSPTSWSIVLFRPVKGPMNAVQGDPSVLISPSALSGNITLTATRPVFDPDDVGTLFRLFHNGQNVVQSLDANETFTDCIRVSGVSVISVPNGSSYVNVQTTDRQWTLTISGTWVGTLLLERSFEGPKSGFTNGAGTYGTIGTVASYTSNTTATINDGQNNVIIWYRLGFEAGGYTSGTVNINMSYIGGGGAGVCHITGYVSPTQVTAEVLVPFFNTTNATDWRQSEWSFDTGFPTAVSIHGGRLWWAGADRWWGSTSDDYNNFDYDATGNAAYIDETIGQGPIANINWLLSLDHLLAGADTSIIMARSDAIESPITPQNFNLRQSVTNGSFPIQAVRVDQRAVYVDQSGRRLYELIYDIQNYNYKPSDLTRLNPDIGIPGFVDMAVQRQPDTRINLIRADGILASFLYDIDDQVEAFWKAQTQGSFENIAVLPGALEDQVYVVVNRTINGVTKRYLEKFARIDECQGGAINKNVDAHIVYSGPATNVISGLGHLIGQTVCVWSGNYLFPNNMVLNDFNSDESSDFGAQTDPDLGTFIVDNTGSITLGSGLLVTTAVVGLPYSAEFISAKLAYAAKMGTAVNRVKRFDHIGMVLSNTHAQGIRYGRFNMNDPTNVVDGVFTIPPVLDSLPLIEEGGLVRPGTIWAQYDKKMFEFPSDNATDDRIYLQAASPRPATVLAITFTIETSG